jgi:hypothetical protein
MIATDDDATVTEMMIATEMIVTVEMTAMGVITADTINTAGMVATAVTATPTKLRSNRATAMV